MSAGSSGLFAGRSIVEDAGPHVPKTADSTLRMAVRRFQVLTRRQSAWQEIVGDAQDVDIREDADQAAVIDDGERADPAVEEDFDCALER